MSEGLLKKLISANSYEVCSTDEGYLNLVITGSLKRRLDADVLKGRDLNCLDALWDEVKQSCCGSARTVEERKKEKVPNPYQFWDLLKALAVHLQNRPLGFIAEENFPHKAVVLVDGENLDSLHSFVDGVQKDTAGKLQK